MTPSTRALGRVAVAVALSGGILGYLFAANDLDPRALGPVLAAISLPGVAAFLVISVAALLLRALRYWVLLERRAPFGPLVLVTLVRNLFVDLVPARAGAAASYLYLVTARLGLPTEAAVASFALSFIFDTLAVAPLLLVAVLLAGPTPLPPAVLVGFALAVLAGALAALGLLAPGLRLLARLAARLPARLRVAAAALAGAAAEVDRLRGRRVLAPVLIISLLLRVTKYGAYYCLLQALLVGQGHAWGSLNLLRVFLSLAGAEIAASLPFPAIASLGPYEAAGALGFSYWLGLPRDLAVLAVTAFHVLSQIHDYGLGLLALLWLTGTGARWGPDGRRAV